MLMTGYLVSVVLYVNTTTSVSATMICKVERNWVIWEIKVKSPKLLGQGSSKLQGSVSVRVGSASFVNATLQTAPGEGNVYSRNVVPTNERIN